MKKSSKWPEYPAIHLQQGGLGELPWQPMATAPLDRRILLKDVSGRCYMGQWDRDKYAKKPRPYWSSSGFLSVIKQRSQVYVAWLDVEAT